MPEKATDRKIYDAPAVEAVIRIIRNTRVILDADLARFYGVTTKAFNQAVKRNPDRFPIDFGFQLTADEFATLRSQSVTSKPPIHRPSIERRSRPGSVLHYA